jgi:hypothetical protein
MLDERMPLMLKNVFRVLGLIVESVFYFAEKQLRKESVGSEVSSVCFCLSVLSKNNCNSVEDKQTQH